MKTIASETTSGFTEVTVDGRMLLDRRLYLTGEITSEVADDFLKQIMLLCEERNGTEIPDIDIIIDSNGGEVNSGLMIYDIIKSLEGKVVINMYCTRMAASMAAIIFAGGQKGRRFILPHSKVMIHEPLIPNGTGGSASDISKTAEDILKTKHLLNSLIAKDTGKSLNQVNKDTTFDNFMNATEAIKYGICDEVRNPLERIIA